LQKLDKQLIITECKKGFQCNRESSNKEKERTLLIAGSVVKIIDKTLNQSTLEDFNGFHTLTLLDIIASEEERETVEKVFLI